MLGIWRAKLTAIKIIMSVITVFFTTLLMISVVWRYVFNGAIVGLEELATYSAVWAYFLGGAYGSYERSQISASLVPAVVKDPRMRLLVEILVNLITIGILIAMTWTIADYVSWSIQRKPRSLELGVSLYWFHLSMLVGFVLMTFYSILELVDNILVFLGRDVMAISPLKDEATR